MLAQIEAINSAVNGVVWGPIMLVLLVGTGIYLTFRTRGLQARRFGFILRNTIGTLFSKDKKKSGSQHNLTPFQAVSTALAGTVGTGNIAGVTGAIFVGGPGAVFWMWVSAFFGMMTKYAEIVLSVKYRQVDEKGAHYGGPMYYIEKGRRPEVAGHPLRPAGRHRLLRHRQHCPVHRDRRRGAVPHWIGSPVYRHHPGHPHRHRRHRGVKRIGQVASYLVPLWPCSTQVPVWLSS